MSLYVNFDIGFCSLSVCRFNYLGTSIPWVES